MVKRRCCPFAAINEARGHSQRRRELPAKQLRSRKLFAAKIILVADEGSRREQDNLGARVNCCENNSESGRSEQEEAGAGSIITAHVEQTWTKVIIVQSYQ
jgi:hypothetical protein